jgi:hypothetical protein
MKPIFTRIFLCLLLAGKIFHAHAQNDLPSPSANIETIPAGAWIVPMDNTWQGTSGIMNLKAYGLINQLLWNDIHVKWAIKAGKAQDSTDFRVSSYLNFPSVDNSSELPGQNFETAKYTPNWTYSNSGGGTNTTANKYNDGKSWRMAKNQNITMSNTSLENYTNVQLSVAFASNGNVPSTGDLYLDISYDNGATWTGTGSVRLAAGGSTAFDINTTNGNTVSPNPYIVDIPNSANQISVRLRTTNTGSWPGSSYYYVDDIKLTGTNNRGFASGPFIIMPADTAAARTIIDNYNSPLAAASKVNVYKMNTSANIDIRYTLVHKPMIAVYDDGGNASIHTTYLTNAGISSTYYDTLGSGHMIDSLTCYTFACTPHWKPGTYTRSDSIRLNNLAGFVRNGGNFLAECEGVDAVENYGPYHYMSTTGFNNLSAAVTTVKYMNMDMPVMQINGAVVPDGGSEPNWNLPVGGSYVSPRYKGLYFISGSDTANIVNITKYRASNLVGGIMVYLGGHSYAGTTIGNINGQRIFLNSILLPARNFATSCNPTSNSPVCIGDTLKLYGNPMYQGMNMAWTGPNSFSSSVEKPTIANMSAAQAGTYTFTITTKDHSCSYAFGSVVVVPTKPVISISNSNTTICEGDSVTLTLSSSSGLSTAKWYIDTAATCRPTGSPIGTGFTLKVYPTSTTKYIGIGYTSTGNCADTTTNCITVTVDKKPILTSPFPTSSPLCYGRGTTVTITPGSGGSGCSDSYQWRQDGGSWSSYTSGTKVGTTAHDSVEVRATRTCTLGCNVVVRLKWNVTAQQTAAGSATLLNCANSGGYIANLTSTNPSPSTGAWTIGSGPGSIVSPTSFSTTIGNLSKTGVTTTLYWIVTNSYNCKDTATAIITPPAMDSGTISQYGSNFCLTCPSSSGNTINYYDANGKLLASIKDSADAVSIGQTNFCTELNYPPGGDPTVSDVDSLDTYIQGAGHIPQPYLPRYWNVNTTTDAPMTINLYFTDAELAALQGATMNNGNYYYFDTAPELLIAAYPNNSDTLVPAGSSGGLVIHPTFTRVDGVWQVSFRMAQSATFYLYPSFWEGSALPVELTSFTARPKSNYIELNWITASEKNCNRFEVERCLDGVQFQKIGIVNGNGNSNSVKYYSYPDYDVKANIQYYYRLRQVDNNREFHYSKIVVSSIRKKENLNFGNLVPNPASEKTSIVITSVDECSLNVRILSIDGVEIKNFSYPLMSGDNKIDIDLSQFSRGTYIFRFETADNIIIKKLMKAQ